MKLVKCNAGHYYDGDKYESCPHCSRVGQEMAETAPLEKQKGKDTMTSCSHGHFMMLRNIVLVHIVNRKIRNMKKPYH